MAEKNPRQSEHFPALCNAVTSPLFVISAMPPLFYEKEVAVGSLHEIKPYEIFS